MIGYYVHHHGLGHLRRFEAIAAHLRTSVTGLSSLAAPPSWRGDWVVLPRDDEPSTGPDPTAGGLLHWAPRGHPGLRSRMAALASWIDQARPALVVTDVSVEVTVLARLMGVPVAVMAMAGDRTDPPHRLAYDLADGLIASWPSAAAAPDWPTGWHAKTAYVGAFSRFDDRVPPAVGRGREVLVLWGAGGDDVSDTDRAAAQAATPGWRWTYRLGGAGGECGDSDDSGAGGDVWADLVAAHVVVVHGGNNAVAEVAAARRPAVVVAQRRPFDEQVHRARAVHRAGIATGLERWPAAEAWPALLDEAVARDAERWSLWSPGDGARRAATELERLAGP